MRAEGCTLREIADRCAITTKKAYYATWDMPVPVGTRQGGGDHAHMEMMRRRYWDRLLAERETQRQEVKTAHAARVGTLSPREIELAAVVAYWCEGSKSKTYDRRERVTFINSDPGLILLFLAWLDQIGFPKEQRRFSLSIHESADVPAATSWWAVVVDVPTELFGTATLKRHNARTVRKNVEEAYVGCLVVRLVQSRTLYQQIEGTWQGIMGGRGSSDGRSRR